MSIIVLRGKMIPHHIKGKIYKKIVQPAMLYVMETVLMTSYCVKKREVAELKMCVYIWACGHTLIYHVGTDIIKERLDVEKITEREIYI